MPQIACTSWLRDIGPHSPESCEGGSIGELLDNLEQNYPRLKSYILDDQGRLRKHVAVFINEELQKDDDILNRRISDDDVIYVMQALSGG